MAAAPQYCAVTIRGEHFLLRLKEGMRVLEILSRAVPLERTYTAQRPHWRISEAEACKVEIETLRGGDVDLGPTASHRAAGRARLIEQGGR
ncbi:hypothetical protein SAMN05428997_14616 [Bosea sp. CRIB-10]|uniref:hypothetical protein n=1 Tax=Bosea sp. CRIB-10 TaxID=378404 RepID=UPI0008F323F4|nr:hypothetical protein [Bosea sp. CRIB-10]SFD72715.1 hypothetical protein SAMN05428997_14616 [Bosea sp. CRIB-10]